MRFGDVLYELLTLNELSQKELAKDLNLAASTIGNYIRNVREPDHDTLKKIAAYFRVSVDYLLDYHSEKTETHEEDNLLQIYRSLPANQKELFLEQGKLLVRYSLRKRIPSQTPEG
ncbi:MAG: helix-turn-helix transcriptional regulator [Clostridiales bacterium]|nr:helix-turn-helix transcriptional regulator [Clostridiales bacterium]